MAASRASSRNSSRRRGSTLALFSGFLILFLSPWPLAFQMHAGLQVLLIVLSGAGGIYVWFILSRPFRGLPALRRRMPWMFAGQRWPPSPGKRRVLGLLNVLWIILFVSLLGPFIPRGILAFLALGLFYMLFGFGVLLFWLEPVGREEASDTGPGS